MIIRAILIGICCAAGVTLIGLANAPTPRLATVSAPEPIPGKQWVCAGPKNSPICKWMSAADCHPVKRYEQGLRQVCAGKRCAWTGRMDTCDPRPDAPVPRGKVAVCADRQATKNCRWEDAKVWR